MSGPSGSLPAGNLAGNLMDGLPPGRLPGELFTTLAAAAGTRIERIVSTGQASPAGFWYDQGWDEFVLLVQGAAALEIAGAGAAVEERRLGPGDWVMIPARTRHRVAWTAPDAATVWLAVHIAGPDGGPHP